MPWIGQLAVLGDQRRRQILDADARAAGDDDDVGVGVKRLEDRVALVGHQAREVDDAAVALDQRREHRTVGVGDSKAVRPRAGWQQFVAGHDQPHARPADTCDVADADRAQHAEILRPQHAAASNSVVPRTMSSPRLPTFLPGDTAARALTD